MGATEGARALVEQSLNVKSGEKVLVLTDPDREALAQILFEAVLEATPEALLVKMKGRAGPGQEPPAPVVSLMIDCDAVLLVTTHSMTHTLARRAASRAGARVLSMPGATLDMLSEGSLAADYVELEETMRRVNKRLRGTRVVRMTTEGGTDLTFSVRGREWITEDVGICRRRGECTSLPAGEIFVAPQEGSAEGKLVIDVLYGEPGPTAPPKVTLREGYAAKILGAHRAVVDMNQVGLEARNFARFGFGLNPRAKIVGNPLEDPKTLGAVRVAFGDNAAFGGKVHVGFQVDALVRNATVEADGKTVLDHGRLKV